MGTAQRPDPTESVRHQLRPLFDQIVIKALDQDRVRRSGSRPAAPSSAASAASSDGF